MAARAQGIIGCLDLPQGGFRDADIVVAARDQHQCDPLIAEAHRRFGHLLELPRRQPVIGDDLRFHQQIENGGRQYVLGKIVRAGERAARITADRPSCPIRRSLDLCCAASV